MTRAFSPLALPILAVAAVGYGLKERKLVWT